MARKSTSPADIPVLTDVIVPGQRAARGQTTREERRASDIDSEVDDEEVDDINEINEVDEVDEIDEVEEMDQDPLYEHLLEDVPLQLDVEGAIDRVLDRHGELLREALREEFTRLLQQARRRR